MDVLNAYEYVVDVMSDIKIFAIVVGILALLIMIVANNQVIFGVFLIVLFVSVLTLVFSPMDEITTQRYEVILRDPGATIDATKYSVIEKRGDIYVIEAREVSK